MQLRAKARISTEDSSRLRPVLDEIVRRRQGTYRTTAEGFEVEFRREARSAREANRELLGQLRRAVKKTQLWAEWTHGDTTEQFFDEVSEGMVRDASESQGPTL